MRGDLTPRVSLGKQGDLIADVIGFYATVRLIRALKPSGSRSWRRCLYVPEQMTEDHMVAQLIGLPLARRLSEAFGGMILQPATEGRIEQRRREIAVQSLRRAGHTLQEVSDKLGLPYSTVRSIVSRSTRGGRSAEKATDNNDMWRGRVATVLRETARGGSK